MSGRVLVLTGGVGGAKLVSGLARVMDPHRITAVVNTGDDFRHLGLWVSPDIDTLLYTLAGKADPVKGWGRASESWSFMAAARSLGMEDWFQLGDGDLALHVDRTSRLAAGETLGSITARHAAAWGVRCEILPMSDDPAPTLVETDIGLLSFQDYFVRFRCQPSVRAIQLAAADRAHVLPAVLARLADPALEAILVAPSNPFLSIDPILALPGMRAALACAKAPVVAVSPLIGGKAVKGPTGKIMAELGIAPTATTIAAHYFGFVDAMLIDHADAGQPPPLPHALADTLMHDDDGRARVAAAALALAAGSR